MNYLHKHKRNSDRLFLDESKLIRTSKLKSNLPLLEVDGGNNYIERCKRDRDLPIYLVGILQSGDKPNRNNRIYPFEYLKRECLRYMDDCVKTGLSYMQLDHDEDSSTPLLDDAAGTIEDIWFKGKDVWGRIKVLNAYMPENAPGLKVRGFILNKKSVGVSSRALGSVFEDEQTGYDIVEDDLEIICWDFVSNASNFGSEVLKLTESKKSKLLIPTEKKLLTESQCFGGVCGLTKPTVNELRMLNLTESEKTYLNILGVERFLQEKYKSKAIL